MSENSSINDGDLRVRRTRQSLIDAIFRLLQDKAFDKITVQNITNEAQVNRSTLYAHFEDKYDLVRKAIGHRIHQDINTVMDGDIKPNDEKLRRFIILIDKILGSIAEDCLLSNNDALAPIIMHEMQTEVYKVMVEWATKEMVEQDKSILPEPIAMVATGSIFGSVFIWREQNTSIKTIEQLADQLIPIIQNSVGITTMTHMNS